MVSSNPSKKISLHGWVGAFIALPWCWLCWRYWDFYPLWDAAIYFEDALKVADKTLNPLAYNIARHPTMGYLYWPAIATRVFGKSYRVFLIYNALLGWWMSVAVADIARRLLRHEYRRLDLLLVVGSAMYCPAVVASMVQLTPDFGVLVFLTLATAALLRERFVRAAIWGILAGWSKESGVLLFATVVLCYLLVFGARAQRSKADRLGAIMHRLPLLLAAGVAPGIVKAFDAVEENQIMAQGGGVQGLIRQFLSVSFLDNVLPASLSTIVVLNCMWLPTALLLFKLGSWCMHALLLDSTPRRRRSPTAEFITWVFVAELFLLTRFRTFTNVRYYLPVFPWLLLLSSRAMLDWRWTRSLRLVAQAIVLLAIGVSNFRSFDPISARIFDTIPFGERRLFHVTSLTGECCGLGRDQLVYNLEFAQIDRILRDILPYVLGRSGMLAVHPQANWYVFQAIEPATKQRTMPTPKTLRLPFIDPVTVELSPHKPERIYFIALPNMPNAGELLRYARYYSVGSNHRFERDGYFIEVLELVRKP